MKICGGQPNLRERYGGKGSSLLYVNHLGLPTRDGFILPTTIPRAGLHRSEPPWVEHEITSHLQQLEEPHPRPDENQHRPPGAQDAQQAARIGQPMHMCHYHVRRRGQQVLVETGRYL